MRRLLSKRVVPIGYESRCGHRSSSRHSWPRAEAKEPAPTHVEVVPVAPSPTPAAPPATSAKDAAGKNAAKKPVGASAR